MVPLDDTGTCAESKLSLGHFCFVQLNCFWLCDCEHVTSHVCARPTSRSVKQNSSDPGGCREGWTEQRCPLGMGQWPCAGGL